MTTNDPTWPEPSSPVMTFTECAFFFVVWLTILTALWYASTILL